LWNNIAVGLERIWRVREGKEFVMMNGKKELLGFSTGGGFLH
jgi:hypothetical protein